MAKQVEDIVVRLVGEGFEALDKIKGSFRELGKVTNLAEKDILSARDSLLDFAKKAGNTEAVNKGLIDAFKGLRSQTQLCGDAYRELSGDIEAAEAASRGYTTQAEAQRTSLAAQYGAITNNTEALRRQRTALVELQQATRGGSQLFTQLGTDIERTTARLEEIEGIQRRTDAIPRRGLASSAAKANRDLADVRARIALERAAIDELNLLTAEGRRQFAQGELRGPGGVTRAIQQRQQTLGTQLTQEGSIAFGENVRQRRDAVRTANAVFSTPEFLSGSRSPDNLNSAFGPLPNTIAGINQGLSELRTRLDNTTIGTTAFIDAAVRAAAAQRELREATLGVASAFVQQLRTGEITPSLTNLREVISSVRTEQALLNTSTTNDARAFQLLELQARALERQLSALQTTQANLAATPASGFAAFSQSITPQAGDRAIQGSIERNRARRERERRRLEREAEDFFSQQPTLPLLLPAAGQTTSRGPGGAVPLRGQRGALEGVGRPLQGPTPPPFGPALSESFIYEQEALRKKDIALEASKRTLNEYRAAVDKAAGANDKSVNSMGNLREAITRLRNAVPSTDAEFDNLTKRLQRLDQQIEKTQTRGRRLTGSQLAQGAGAALSGGIFGGPEGLIGGLGGLAVGGVGGAFAGAAAGAQVGMFRQQLAGTADYAASIGKLQIALRGVVGSQEAYDAAIRSAAAATRDLNIPQEEATRGLTRLSAAVIGAGGTVADSSFAFRAMSEAIKATGGNAEQVDGALLALTQVFSKGKVSAEELNQIAERLPGTFTLFAQAAGKTGPELQKALEQGEVGLNDLMKFLALTGERYGKLALDISSSSQDAGARLTVAFQAMRLEVGKALQPLGAELQGAFATFIKDITPAIVGSAKAIAAALSFLTTNDLVAFGVQLTAVSLGFKGLQVAAAALTSLNVASWFTATAVGAKVTSSGMAAATVTTGGLTGAIKALTLAMAKNPLTLLILAGTAAAIKVGSVVLEQKKLNDEVQRSLDIAAKAPASGIATEINTTENALREARSKLAGGLQGSDVFGFGLIAAEADVARLEAKLQKLKTTFKGRVEIETIFKGLGAVPEGYKVVNGRLAYLSPGQGYVDAETGKPVGKGRTNFPGGGGEDGGEKAGAALLQAIEQREEALLNLRTQREEQLAQIREQAVEQAKQIETQLADRRLAIERQIQDIQRQGSDFIEDSERRIRAARGEDTGVIDAEQKIVDIFREERDSRIDSERRLADDKQEQERTIAEFQRGVAKSINDANRAHTKSMGEIQKQYATSVAKIIDEGTGKAGKRLAAAAQLAALYIQRGTLNSQIAATTGIVIPARRQGGYSLSDVGIGQGNATAESLKQDTTFKDTQVPLRVIIDGIDPSIQKLQKEFNLSRTPTRRTPVIGDQFTALLGAEGGYEDVAMTRGQAALIIKKLETEAIKRNISADAFAAALTYIGEFASSADESRRAIRNLMATPGAGIAVRSPGLLRNLATRQLSKDQADIKASGVNPASLTKQIEPMLAIISQLQKDNLLRKNVTLSETKEQIQKPLYGALMDWIKANLNNTQLQEILKTSLFGQSNTAYGTKGILPQAAGFEPASFGIKLTPAALKEQQAYEARRRYEASPAGKAEKAAAEEYARQFRESQRKLGPRSDADVPGSFDTAKIATDFGQIASASFIGGLLAQNFGAPRAIPESQILRDSQGRPLNGNQPTAYPLPAIPSAEPTTQLRNTLALDEKQQREAETAQKIKEAFEGINAEAAQFTNGLNDQIQLLEDQRRYLDMGFSDALSRDLANLDKGLADRQMQIMAATDQLILQIQAAGEDTDPTVALGAYADAVARSKETYDLQVKITKELEKQTKALSIRQDNRIGLGAQEGVQAYLESIGTMRDAFKDLTVNGIQGVENAIFELVTTGKTNFREFAADMLRQTARIIIQQLVLRQVLMIVKEAFKFADGGVFAPSMQPRAGYAKGGAFGSNNIIPYAKGGTFTNSIVSRPTLFKFAAGGTMQTGLMGEAGPEAIMPLKRGPGGKLGVMSSGGGGGTTNVTVNVDASGSKTQGDSAKSEQLGRAVSQAVQDELLRQRRPGGILA